MVMGELPPSALLGPRPLNHERIAVVGTQSIIMIIAFQCPATSLIKGLKCFDVCLGVCIGQHVTVETIDYLTGRLPISLPHLPFPLPICNLSHGPMFIEDMKVRVR